MFEILKMFWLIIKSLWWVWVIALGIILIELGFNYLSKRFGEKRWKKWLEKHKKLEDWKKLDGREFEKVVAAIYRNLGYKTKLKGGPKDRGIDIIVKKGEKRNFIQCKRMDKVSPGAIREFYGSIVNRLKEGEKGIFVTTGEFTEEGREFTRDKPIELIDGIKLENLARS